MKLIAVCFTLILALQVKAAELKLATITSNVVDETTIFYVETNEDGSAQAMRYVTTTRSGQVTEDIHHTMEVILNGGVTLKDLDGREIIRLFVEKFNADKGADLRLNYLVNGITGSNSNHYLKLVKTPEGGFALADTKGKMVNTIVVNGNWSRLLRRWIGVSSLSTSFEVKNK